MIEKKVLETVHSNIKGEPFIVVKDGGFATLGVKTETKQEQKQTLEDLWRDYGPLGFNSDTVINSKQNDREMGFNPKQRNLIQPGNLKGVS